jgi:hypothetical protein
MATAEARLHAATGHARVHRGVVVVATVGRPMTAAERISIVTELVIRVSRQHFQLRASQQAEHLLGAWAARASTRAAPRELLLQAARRTVPRTAEEGGVSAKAAPRELLQAALRTVGRMGAADAVGGGLHQPRSIRHTIVSRTAGGSAAASRAASRRR